MMILQVRVYEHLILTLTLTQILSSLTVITITTPFFSEVMEDDCGKTICVFLKLILMGMGDIKQAPVAQILLLFMFPTSLEHPFQQSRGRRRGRNEPNNRDYICPCGKSYLSYPALFTHIKIKHNGRAPGQVIKPRSEYANRRGRPKAKEVYDSDSDTEDIAANCIDRLCDFVSDTERWEDDGLFKQVYMKSDFYEIYVNFNPQEQQPKYDQSEQLYDQTCANVFCQFLAEINKRLAEPYYFDILFAFFMMLARSIDQQFVKGDKQSEYQQEMQDQNSSSPKDGKRASRVQLESIKSIINIINPFMIRLLPKYKKEYQLEKVPLFMNKNAAKLIEYFSVWLTNKKYLGCKIRINESYNFQAQ